MEVRAVSKSVRMSPRKVRLIADAIRHLSIEEAYRVLAVTNKRAARAMTKTLQSAVANAVHNANLRPEDLVIGTILVNEGQALKRFRPSTRGRIHPYKKRGSHITVVVKSVAEAPAQSAVKSEAKQLPPKREKTKEKGAKEQERKSGEVKSSSASVGAKAMADRKASEDKGGKK